MEGRPFAMVGDGNGGRPAAAVERDVMLYGIIILLGSDSNTNVILNSCGVGFSL